MEADRAARRVIMDFLKRHHVFLGTILFDLFLLWTVVTFVFSGWERTVRTYEAGPTLWGWIILVLVVLNLIKSDYRTDIPMYVSAFGLAYWLEWWGTTRGVWTYSTNQTPPLGEIFLWGICLLSVFHTSLLFLGKGERKETKKKYTTWAMVLVLCILPLIAFILTWKFIISVDWMKYFDIHSVVAVVFAAVLILKDFDLRQTFLVFLGGTFLGGFLETLGTGSGRYAYLSGTGAPLMVGPIWGVTCVVMVKFGYQLKRLASGAFSLLFPAKAEVPAKAGTS
jgi:hypothetical protein